MVVCDNAAVGLMPPGCSISAPKSYRTRVAPKEKLKTCFTAWLPVDLALKA
jgi:hypothetical protein